jgi:glycosyltransferase involved in cell wall biosynthesis
MRVLTLTHNLPRFLGDYSGTFVDALCRELVRQGEEVCVLAPHDRAYASLQPRPYRLKLYRYAWPSRLEGFGYARSMSGDLGIRPTSLALAPGVLAAGIASALQLCGKWRADILHAHWLFPSGVIAAVVSAIAGVPYIVSLPGSDVFVARRYWAGRLLGRWVLRKAALVTANSRELQRVALSLGAPAERFDLVIYGADTTTLHPDREAGTSLRQALGLRSEDFVVLAVGRMVPKKGFRYLAEAFPQVRRHVPSARLVFVGDGVERCSLEAALADSGFGGDVRFVGVVPRQEMLGYYNAADVLVMPSVTEPEDGLNVCVLDAMACARPIVATTAAGNSLVVQDGLNGFLVPERDATALAEKLILLAGDAQMRERMGAASRALAENDFSWATLAARYRAHYRRTVAVRSEAR